MQKDTTAPIAIRVNPDISAGGHPKISTGKKSDKFGISYGETKEIYSEAKSLGGISLVGLDMHIGSQITDIDSFTNAFDRITTLFLELNNDGYKLNYLDIGGGIGISYKENENKKFYEDLLEKYVDLVVDMQKKTRAKIILEPGRFLIGNAGIIVTKVLYNKITKTKNFLIVDLGMNDFLRPALYSAKHDLKMLKNTNLKGVANYDVVGPICESSDIIADDVVLPEKINKGDYLVIFTAGAYGAVMSSNYNTRGIIAEILIKDNKYSIIRRRQNTDELIKLEKFADWL